MNQIPPLAWIAIIVVALITILIYFILFALLRGRDQMKDIGRRLQSRPPNRVITTIQKVQEVARDPFRDDREQINELSRLVSDLNRAPSGDAPKPLDEKQGPPEAR